MSRAGITVGEAARRAGVSAKAVRLYESRGILPPAERTEAGYRTYTEGDVEGPALCAASPSPAFAP
jgi:DNA-binding transcriptional MerR regulator